MATDDTPTVRPEDGTNRADAAQLQCGGTTDGARIVLGPGRAARGLRGPRGGPRGPLPPLDRVYAPVGLSLGAVSPEVIAISIVAELVAVRHGLAGKPAVGAHLRDVPEDDSER